MGSLLTSRLFNSFALKATMKGAWRTHKGFIFREIQNNCFVFHFVDRGDKDRVLKGGPWLFNKSLLVLRELGDEHPSKMTFDKSEFWVRIYDLPISMMNLNMTKKLGASLGEVSEIDEPNLVMCGRFIRIRVVVDLKKLLRRGIMVACGTRKIWAEVKYERLSNFCYTCGVLGQVDLDCDDEEARDWLRASPMKVKDQTTTTEKAKEHTFWSSVQKDSVDEANEEDREERTEEKNPEKRVNRNVTGKGKEIVESVDVVKDVGNFELMMLGEQEEVTRSHVVTQSEKGNNAVGGEPNLNKEEGMQGKKNWKRMAKGSGHKEDLGKDVEIGKKRKETEKRRDDRGDRGVNEGKEEEDQQCFGFRCDIGTRGECPLLPEVMNAIRYNCQGLEKALAVTRLTSLVKKEALEVLFLMETKCDRRKMEEVRRKLGFARAFTMDCVGSPTSKSKPPPFTEESPQPSSRTSVRRSVVVFFLLELRVNRAWKLQISSKCMELLQDNSTNVNADLRALIQSIFDVREVDKHEKYLGFPTMVRKSKKVIFGQIKDRILKKIRRWHSKHLSYTGKEVLIKAFAQVIPNYTMSCFKLPIDVCEETEQIFCKYWWGSDNGSFVCFDENVFPYKSNNAESRPIAASDPPLQMDLLTLAQEAPIPALSTSPHPPPSPPSTGSLSTSTNSMGQISQPIPHHQTPTISSKNKSIAPSYFRAADSNTHTMCGIQNIYNWKDKWNPRSNNFKAIKSGIYGSAERVIDSIDWDLGRWDAEKILWGLRCCIEKGFRKIEVESDSLAIISKLRKEKPLKGVYGWMLSKLCEECRWSHVRRNGNSVAHYLANFRPQSFGVFG
ncbi:hypothetical protein V2J09_008840 [Rumex salicifolius]